MNHVKFTETHEWINTEASEMTIGITNHAQKLLGDLVYVELPEVGKEVQAGDEIGVVESVKAASDFYAPISGTISEINQQVISNPALVNTDPYGQGWLVKIKPSTLEELPDLPKLMTKTQYETLLGEDD